MSHLPPDEKIREQYQDAQTCLRVADAKLETVFSDPVVSDELRFTTTIDSLLSTLNRLLRRIRVLSSLSPVNAFQDAFDAATDAYARVVGIRDGYTCERAAWLREREGVVAGVLSGVRSLLHAGFQYVVSNPNSPGGDGACGFVSTGDEPVSATA